MNMNAVQKMLSNQNKLSMILFFIKGLKVITDIPQTIINKTSSARSGNILINIKYNDHYGF